MDVLQGTSRYPQPMSTGAATQTSLHQVGRMQQRFKKKKKFSVTWKRLICSWSIVKHGFYCFLQRGLTESTYLKRSEAVGPVPSITISIPKPSFATSGASATVDKPSTLNHVTGCCQSCDVATTRRSCPMWIFISNKAFYLLLWSSSEAELSVSQAVFFRQKHGVSSWNLSSSQFLLSMVQQNGWVLNV